MEETYTYDALMVQFLYRELSAGDVVETAHLIEEDPDMRAEYNALAFAKAQFPKVQFNPSTASLNKILQYSAKTAQKAHF